MLEKLQSKILFFGTRDPIIALILRTLFSLSEKRDSNPRPRPWQGRALPTELFSHILLYQSRNLENFQFSLNFVDSRKTTKSLINKQYRNFLFFGAELFSHILLYQSRNLENFQFSLNFVDSRIIFMNLCYSCV